MSVEIDGFGTIVKNLTEGSGGLAGTGSSEGSAGAGAVGKTFRIVQDEVLLDDPSCVAVDASGNLWVGNDDDDASSLVKLDGTTFAPTLVDLWPSSPFELQDEYVEVTRMKVFGSHLFVATGHGAVYVVNTTTNAVVGSLIRLDGDENDIFIDVCIDDSGNVYALLGTSPSTIYKWTAPFTVTGKVASNEFQMGHNMSGLIFAEGYLWSGSGGGDSYLHRIDPTTGAYVSQDTGMTYAWMPHYVSTQSRVYIAGPEALHGYSISTFPAAAVFNAALGLEDGAQRDVREVVFSPEAEDFFVFCDSRKESVLRVSSGGTVIANWTYTLLDGPRSPIVVGGHIWFCNNDDDVSGEGALVRLNLEKLSFDVRYQGTTKVVYLDDTGRGNWCYARGGVQTSPFLSAGGRIIWGSINGYGNAIQNNGGDTFRLHGGYDVPHHFKLVGNIGSADGVISYQWYDVTQDQPLGRLASTSPNVTAHEACAYLTVPAGKSRVIELRIMYANALTQIGQQGGPEGDIYPDAFINVIGAGDDFDD
jgi:hypothetical protein